MKRVPPISAAAFPVAPPTVIDTAAARRAADNRCNAAGPRFRRGPAAGSAAALTRPDPLDRGAESAQRGPLDGRDLHVLRQLEGDRTRHRLALGHVNRPVVEVGVARDALEVRCVAL